MTFVVLNGLFIGIVAGYFRLADAIIMRVMDGMMAIPGILLAIALVSLSGASLLTVLVAISVPDIPRVVRMVRSVILSVRNESYVEAAVVLGTPVPVLMWRHMLPSTLAPLIVQGTYIFASAILAEAATFGVQLIFAMAKAKLYRELDKRSRTDGLTGLSRRGPFEERLKEEFSRSQRAGAGRKC